MGRTEPGNKVTAMSETTSLVSPNMGGREGKQGGGRETEREGGTILD